MIFHHTYNSNIILLKEKVLDGDLLYPKPLINDWLINQFLLFILQCLKKRKKEKLSRNAANVVTQ